MGLTDEELDIARDLRIKAKRLAARVKSRSSGRMDPQDTPWHEASELADTADTAAWCIGWLVAEVGRLRWYETFYRELNASTAPATTSAPEAGNAPQETPLSPTTDSRSDGTSG